MPSELPTVMRYLAGWAAGNANTRNADLAHFLRRCRKHRCSRCLKAD
jgi:hypothetical protein